MPVNCIVFDHAMASVCFCVVFCVGHMERGRG